MNRKPDVIRSLVLIFVAGLVISGFSQLGASEKASSAQPPQYQQDEGSSWRQAAASQ